LSAVIRGADLGCRAVVPVFATAATESGACSGGSRPACGGWLKLEAQRGIVYCSSVCGMVCRTRIRVAALRGEGDRAACPECGGD
jgi:hypothetical protein